MSPDSNQSTQVVGAGDKLKAQDVSESPTPQVSLVDLRAELASLFDKSEVAMFS